MNSIKKINGCEQIEVFSDVRDVDQFYIESDFIILPIFSGSGMKVKTCEALMFGKNIIGTNEALEGYSFKEKTTVCRCNSSDEFIKEIEEYSIHPISKFNFNARKTYLEQYSSDSALRQYSEIYTKTFSLKC